MTALKGHHFLAIKLLNIKKKYKKNAAALHTPSKGVFKAHVKALHDFRHRLLNNTHLQQRPLDDALLRHLQMQAKECRVRPLPSTFLRWITSMDGAMSNLGKYSHNFNGKVKLKFCPVWSAALRSWDRLSKETQPIHQPTATAEDVDKAIQLEADPEIRAFLMLLWLMAARKGDIAKLRSKNVDLQPDGKLLAFIAEGKGVLVRQGLYHIPSFCPTVWREELSTFLVNAKKKFLFRPSLRRSGVVLAALRMANPNLNCCAVRRGAAQAMADDPSVSEETIMKITGHANPKTLRRYLGWDKHNAKAHTEAHSAACNNLAPTRL